MFVAGLFSGLLIAACIRNWLIKKYQRDVLRLRRDKEALLQHYREKLEQVVYDFNHKGLIPNLCSLLGLLEIYSLHLKDGQTEEARNELKKAYQLAEKILIELRKKALEVELDIDHINKLIDHVREHGAAHVIEKL